MNDEQFLAFSRARFAEGQLELADAMRTLVARDDADVYEALAEAGDDAFLEPLLFARYFAKPPRLDLPQIAFGHVPPESRPCELPVTTDAEGRVYLPRIGHLVTSLPERQLTACWDPHARAVWLQDDGAPVPHELRSSPHVPGSAIEVLWESNPLLDQTFMNVEGVYVTGPFPSTGPLHESSIAHALALIAAHEPEYSGLLHQATRQVFAFDFPGVNSFATLNAHGVVYFNAGPKEDVVYFVDELVHQCGHVIFNAMTVRRREFFLVDPDRRIADLRPEVARHEERSLYTVLHGLYTERAMVRCLRKLDELGVFRGRRAHELRGRLAFILSKMRIDVDNVGHPGLFTPLGEDLVETFRATLRDAERERGDLLGHVLRGQPYNFDYARYARDNPMERWFSAAE